MADSYPISTAYIQPVPQFPGYGASRDGNVWSRKARGGTDLLTGHWHRLRPGSVDRYGHLGVVLCRGGKRYSRKVHQIILETFVGARPENTQVRHFPDRNPSNNKVENLAWASNLQNCKDRETHGTQQKGEKCFGAILSDAKVIELRKRYRKGGVRYSDLVPGTGTCYTTVRNAILGIKWKHLPFQAKEQNMAATVKIAPRAENLPVYTGTPETSPVEFSGYSDDDSVLQWGEKMKDHYEKEGFAITTKGLQRVVGVLPLEDEHKARLKKQLKRLYEDEGGGPPKSTKKSPKAKGGKKVIATQEKKAKKAAKKAAKVVKKAAAKKPSANGNGHVENKVIFEKTVNGVPCKIEQLPKGQYRPSVFGAPLRAVLRWLGSKGWEPGHARTAVGKLFKTAKVKVDGETHDGEWYVQQLVAEGHVGSGKSGDKGTFGRLAEMDPKEGKVLLGLKPKN